MVSEDNTGSVIESYSVKAGKGIEKATLDNESFLDIDGAKCQECIFNCNKRFKNLWLQFFLSQNQGFMRLFEKTVLK